MTVFEPIHGTLLSVATFDQFWRLTRVHNDADVPELAAHLQEADLQEMDVGGDHEAAECLRHAYEFCHVTPDGTLIGTANRIAGSVSGGAREESPALDAGGLDGKAHGR